MMPGADRRRLVDVRVERSAKRQRPKADFDFLFRKGLRHFEPLQIDFEQASTSATGRCATTLATERPLSGTVTKMSVGLLMKLNELVMI